jgi:hypothetical protein
MLPHALVSVPLAFGAVLATPGERARRMSGVPGELDALLTTLRQDVAWLDRCLAEQAAGSADEVRTLRMEMRIRCDAMEMELARVAAHLEQIAGPRPGDPAAAAGTPGRAERDRHPEAGDPAGRA